MDSATQAPVWHDAKTMTWALTTPRTTYALRLVNGTATHVYWGPRLPYDVTANLPAAATTAPNPADLIGEELPGQGGERYGPASLQVSFADGVAATQWRYIEHAAEGGHLMLRLVDEHYPLELELHYQVRPDSDVIERWSALRHTGADTDDAIVVERWDSAAWNLPQRPDFQVTGVSGEWAAEFQVGRVPLAYGETTITSRRGITRHQSNPWLMVDSGNATEEHGEVWSTALAWSGTWRLTVRRTLGDHVAVTGGAGHEGVRRHLRPGERWESPVLCGLYAADGFGATSRRWHAYTRRYVLSAPDELRPVLYNSWEGSWFDVTEQNQREVAALAADMGAELFVMDDGWFGRRINDRAGLGDWWPNPERFPNGLAPLIAEVHRLGMRFGLWVEPEMVNPDSDLYRAHPDWAMHMPHRQRTEIRHQLVLNFARADVREWAYGWLDGLLTDNEIDFFKWDMNRGFTEAGWPDGDDPHRLWWDHTTGVYEVIDRLRAAHPNLRIESCASGGGRVDLGIFRRTDQAWASDNTDPVDRIPIQHGYTQVYPAITMGAWASDSPNPLTRRIAPVRFRFHVAMAGALGISGELREWSPEELREAAELVAVYKRIRPVVQHGELYRRTAPDPERTTVVQYVSADGAETVVLGFRPMVRVGVPNPPVRLAGLEPDARYRDVDTDEVYEGAMLLHYGLALDLPAGDYASTLVHLRRER